MEMDEWVSFFSFNVGSGFFCFYGGCFNDLLRDEFNRW